MLLFVFFLKSNSGYNYEPIVFQTDTKNTSGICVPNSLDLYDLKLGSCSLKKTWFTSADNGSSTIENFLNARFFPALKAFHESEKRIFSMEKSAIVFKENMNEACLDFKKMKPNYQVLCANREGFEKLMKLKSAELISKGIENYQPLKKNLFGYYYADKKISNYPKRRDHWNVSFAQYVDVNKEGYRIGSKNYTLEDFTKNDHQDFFNGFYKNSAAVFLEAAKDCNKNIGYGPNNYVEKLLSRPLMTQKDLDEFNQVACKYYNPDYIEKFEEGYLKTLFVNSCINGKTLFLKKKEQSSNKDSSSSEKEVDLKDNSNKEDKTKKTKDSITPSPKKKTEKSSVKLELPNAISMPPIYVDEYFKNQPGTKTPVQEMNDRENENRAARNKLLKAKNTGDFNEAKNNYKNVIEKEKKLRINDADKAGKGWEKGSNNRKALEKYYQDYQKAIDNFNRFQELES